MIVVLEFMRVPVFGDVHLTDASVKGVRGGVRGRGGMRGRVPSIEWRYVHGAVGAPVGAYVSVVGA